MLGLTGLIGQSVNFTDDKIHRSFVFVTQGLVRNGDEERMAAMILVPSEIAQFSGVKRLVNEEPFEIQNETDCPEILPCLNKARPALLYVRSS